MKYQQRDIVEINFELPNGQLKPHPVLIISQEEIYNTEELYYIVMLSTKERYPDFVFEITPDMLNYTPPTSVQSYVCCHLIESIEEWEVIKRFGSVKTDTFEQIREKINEVIFGD